MFACSLSNPVDKFHYEEREKRYLKIIKKYNKREQEQFPELAAYVVMALEENPEQDFLGSIFMELNLGDKSNSQFFTPYHVCELMANYRFLLWGRSYFNCSNQRSKKTIRKS